jgi:hypothetical protein
MYYFTRVPMMSDDNCSGVAQRNYERDLCSVVLSETFEHNLKYLDMMSLILTHTCRYE